MPEIEIFTLPLTEIEGEQIDLSVLSAQERERARQMPPHRAHRFLKSRSFVRHRLAEQLGSQAGDIEFDWPVRGKPRLVKPCLHFNISHTRNLLALAISPHSEVGIDLETPGRQNRTDAIAARYFPNSELQWINQATDSAMREWRFLQLWTMKESLSKLIGCGIVPKVLREITRVTDNLPEPNPDFTGPVQQAFAKFQAAGQTYLLSLAAQMSPTTELCLRMDRDFEEKI